MLSPCSSRRVSCNTVEQLWQFKMVPPAVPELLIHQSVQVDGQRPARSLNTIGSVSLICQALHIAFWGFVAPIRVVGQRPSFLGTIRPMAPPRPVRFATIPWSCGRSVPSCSALAWTMPRVTRVAEKYGLPFPRLADSRGETARA
jgi:hypothetical protein